MPDAPGPQPLRALRRRYVEKIPRRHVLVGLTGVVAFLTTFAALHQQPELTALAAVSVDVGEHAPVTAEHLRRVEVPSLDDVDLSLLLSFADAAEAASRAAFFTSALRAGTVLRRSDVSRPDERPSRAMALAVDRAAAVDGRLGPGDLVDVLGFDGRSARVVLAGASVLAVSDSGLAGRGLVLTLAVDDVEALRVAHAVATGRVEVVRATGAEPTIPGRSYPARSSTEDEQGDDA